MIEVLKNRKRNCYICLGSSQVLLKFSKFSGNVQAAFSELRIWMSKRRKGVARSMGGGKKLVPLLAGLKFFCLVLGPLVFLDEDWFFGSWKASVFLGFGALGFLRIWFVADVKMQQETPL
jgi:hypothetical protein